ncbi:MAG: CBS domain-containing protein, partial [Candidatus Altiarchaeales archaeon]|nr:CBS domain-containing protein [Candidatus Altiarchaeales archaeon]
MRRDSFVKKPLGSLDRGARKSESKPPSHVGSIMDVASEKVIYTYHTTSIKEAADLMQENDVRRLPLVNAGTKKLEGIVAAVDILDFLGGGSKYNIILEDFQDNFLSAVNCPVDKIMEEI